MKKQVLIVGSIYIHSIFKFRHASLKAVRYVLSWM
jgi:hypothetical protein